MTTATQTIPKGYRQTEIGVIPVDWDVKTFKDICWVNQGLQIAIEKRLKNPTAKSKKYITIQYLNSGKDTEYIDDYSPSVCCSSDDILMTRTGNTGIVISGVEGVFHNNFFKINFDKKQIEKDYLLYYLKDSRTKKIILEKAGTSTIPDLNHNDFYSILIPLPPSQTERSAIATTLFDTDALMAKLEALIEKKKNIKQGVMQELLTGKRRLPGFSGEWVRKKLGEIGEIIGSGVDKKIRPEEAPVRLLNFLDVFHRDFIYSKDLHHEVTARPDQVVRCSIKKGDVFFTPSSEMPFDIGISAISMEDMPGVVYSYHVDRLRLFEDWDLLFRAYIFQTKDFSNQTATHCEGSGKRYVLNLTTFRERLTVFYPVDKKEQSAISQILFDMDTEIEKLESQLIKYQNLKQGMMQSLLTGKIRLLTK